jgi:adenosylmethionine-8-amino-7-oxononanoate aminotransferase
MHPTWKVGQELQGVVFEKGHGIYIQDIDGKEYIDAGSQLVSNNLGHGRKEIIDAIIEQVKELQYVSIFHGWTHKPIIKCAQKLAEIVPPGLDHFMFVSGGSEANELAMQFARAYWQYNGKNKFKIITLLNAYHGGSMGATTASTLSPEGWDYIEPLVPGFIRIPSYYCYRCSFGLEYPGCGILCARFLEQTIKSQGPGTVAAFIAEPIHGSGGCISPPPEYWPMVSKICKENDVLLIGDEVMAGFARSGKLFAFQHWNVVPNIMTMGKGITGCYIPFGAVAVDEKVWKGLQGYRSHGYTFCGHPLGAAASIAAIDIYVKEKVAENADKVGQHLEKRLKAEFATLPCVGTIRGKGLFRAIEIVKDKETKALFDPSLNIFEKIRAKARDNGLYLRVGGNKNVWVSPPCIITIKEMDMLLDILYPIIAGIKPDSKEA